MTREEAIKKFAIDKIALPEFYKCKEITGVSVSLNLEEGYPIAVSYMDDITNTQLTKRFTLSGGDAFIYPDKERSIIFLDKVETSQEPEQTVIDWTKATETKSGAKVKEIYKVNDSTYFGVVGANAVCKWDELGREIVLEELDLIPPVSEYQRMRKLLEKVTHTRGGYKVSQVLIPDEEIWNQMQNNGMLVYFIKENLLDWRLYSKYGKYLIDKDSEYDLIY